MLLGKKIILGVTASIAAYKAASLVRLLIKEGASVKVVMTPDAKAFISPLTLATLSKNKVHTEIIHEEEWANHVELGLWGDALVVAPATANTLAKMAHGICDNLLLATYLSAKCPVYFAPAMDLDMWNHPATMSNIATLKSYGNQEIPVEFGELASGLVGLGRMAEPESIVAFLKECFSVTGQLSGKKVVITAGPTHEPLDPVRFIGNRSTGKMGIAIADAAAQRGASVTLVLGPTALRPTTATIEVINVETAEQMFVATDQIFSQADVLILCAAVADYKPTEVAPQKIKKKDDRLEIALEKTRDIAATLGAKKSNHQKIIGFALETENETANAESKLQRKNMDYIVLNSLNDAGAGFGYDTNKVSIYGRSGIVAAYDLLPKTEVAGKILDLLKEA